MNFKKITALAGTMLMAGLSITTAAAASFPQPFVTTSGVGDVAIIYGGADAATTDDAAANNLQEALNEHIESTAASTVTGGEVYELKMRADNLNLGDGFRTVLADGKLDDRDLPVFLEDGIYEDSDDTEYDYTQNIYLANETFELIYDKDYMDKAPTLGTYIPKGGDILTYNITYTDNLNTTLMPTTDLKIGGKDYYVLTASTTEINLLDTAQTHTITEGEEVTLNIAGKEYVVSVIVYSSGAVFEVNGETSKQLSSGGYDKMGDGLYLVAKSVRYASKETGVSTVEFSLGQGKITLTSGSEVKVNGVAQSKFVATIVDTGPGSDIDAINFAWNAKEEVFLTGEEGYNVLSMPVFEGIQLLFNGFDFVEEPEVTEFVASDSYISLDTKILDGSLNLPFLYRSATSASNFTGLGAASDNVLLVNSTTGTSTTSYNLTLKESEDPFFVVTYIKGTEGFTHAYELSSVDKDGANPVLNLDNLASDETIKLTGIGDLVNLDGITLKLAANESDENATLEVGTSIVGASIYSNAVVTEEGLTIWLPTTVNGNGTGTAVYNLTTMDINVSEETKDGDIAIGSNFFVNLSSTDADGVHVSATTIATQKESEDFYIGYALTDLGTKVEKDLSGSTNGFVIKYNGKEVTADVQVVVGGEVVTSDPLGSLKFTDAQVSQISANNVIVVGGSCINSAAATLLGGAYCGEEFTSKTKVGVNQYMIKAYEDSAIDGKFALLVAGYEAADTTAAVNKLLNDDSVNTEAGGVYSTTAGSI